MTGSLALDPEGAVAHTLSLEDGVLATRELRLAAGLDPDQCLLVGEGGKALDRIVLSTEVHLSLCHRARLRRRWRRDGPAQRGLGAAVELGSFQIRAEYEAFDISDIEDLYMLSAGFVFTF